MKQGSTLLGGCVAAVIALTASSMAFADPVNGAPANGLTNTLTSGTLGQGLGCCNGNPPPMTKDQVTALEGSMNSPSTEKNSFLSQNPSGGGQMIAAIRDLMLSDSNALSLITGLLSSANAEQQSAIASGLAQAARLWNGSTQGQTVQGQSIGQGVALDIQQQVAQTGDAPFVLAYSNAAGNNPIGAAGGGGGGSAGGPGGGSNSLGGGFFGTGAAEGIGGSGVNTGGFTMTGGVVGAGTTTGSTTTSP
jgi:hypothetical protein